jgi:hypothetical protein
VADFSKIEGYSPFPACGESVGVLRTPFLM